MLCDTLRKWLQVALGKMLVGKENLEDWKQLGKKEMQPDELLVVETTAQQGWNWSDMPLEASYQLYNPVPWVLFSSWPLPLQLRIILRRLGKNLMGWETQISNQLW